LASSITLEGIDSALENLGYFSKSSPKSKFLNIVRDFYINIDDLSKIEQIPLEIIISKIWDIPPSDKAKINSRKKNALSLKNTINKDLNKLFDSGLNSEGIIINENNIFAMSDNAREELLSSFTAPFSGENDVSLSQISQILNSIKEFIEKTRQKNNSQSDFQNIQSLISEIEKNFDEKSDSGGKNESETSNADNQGNGDNQEEVKSSGKRTVTIELDEGEEIEEVFEDEEETIEEQENFEEVKDDEQLEFEEAENDDYEVVELDEDEELVDDEDYQEEEIDDDLTEESDNTEIVETDEIDDSEIIELDEDQELVDDEDYQEEEIDDDLTEESDNTEIVETDEIDDSEIIELDEDQELVDDEDYQEEEIDDDLTEESDNTEIVETDEIDDSEIIELDEDQELVDDEDYQEEEIDDDLTEESDNTEIVETDEIDDSEIIELDEDQELIDDEDEDIEDTEEDQIELEDDDELVEADEIELDEDQEIIDEEDELIDEQIDFEEESINDDSIEEFDEFLQDEEDVLDIDEEESDDSEVVELDEDQELVDDEDYEEEAIDDDLIEEIDELSQDEEIVSDIDEDGLDDTELVEIDEDEDSEDTEEDQIELDDDEELIEADEIELDEDQEIIDEEDEHKLPELGLPSESLGEFESYLESQNIDSKNLLSEKFDSYLGAMDRYYNQFLKIEKNTYKTGCPYPSSDLKSESEINLNEFFIGAFPITNALFEIFIEKTGYKTTAEEKGFSTVFESRYKSEFDYKTGKQKSILSSTGKSTIIRGACWYQPFGPGSGLHKKRSHPVVHISLKDTLSFAAWIGKRLPTEDEWEAAARTDKGFPFPWGSLWKENACNTENCGKGDTAPVDEYIEGINSNKISDTLGNIWEWTTSSIEKAEKTFYIAKGGSFVSDQSVRLWSRYFVKPDFTSNILGFRCVAD
jgi:formylglycine-generating enzyme required for sulfatase activity